MNNAEVTVFEIEDLRRKIFEYVYILPSCKYCFHEVISNNRTSCNDPICSDCVSFFYDFRIKYEDPEYIKHMHKI